MESSAASESFFKEPRNHDIIKAAPHRDLTSKFTELPTEVRIKIYKYLLITSHEIKLEFEGPSQTGGGVYVSPGISVAVQRVSKLLHSEASSVLYGANRFFLLPKQSAETETYEEHLVSMLSAIGNHNCSYLRDVCLYINQPGQSLWQAHAHTISEAFKHIRQLTMIQTADVWDRKEVTERFQSICATACDFAFEQSNRERTLKVIAWGEIGDCSSWDNAYEILDPAWIREQCKCWNQGSRSLLDGLRLPELRALHIDLLYSKLYCLGVRSMYLQAPSQPYDWCFRREGKIEEEADEQGCHFEGNNSTHAYVWKQVPRAVLDDMARLNLHLCKME